MTTTRRHRQDDPLHDPRVALVLAAAAAPTEPGQQPGEAAALAALRGAVPTPTRRIRMLPSLKAAAIAATATGALLTGGIAAASTGALPGAAQDTARTALAKVGVAVPGPADAAGDHPAGRATSAATEAAAPTPTADADADAHGQAVSELATTTDLTGRDKGAAISALASDGRSQAGQHPTATVTPSAAPEADAHGQTTATEHSAGHSSTGTSHRP
jgi:hypothetical protein